MSQEIVINGLMKSGIFDKVLFLREDIRFERKNFP